MRVFAINGSPDGEKGNTNLILGKFLQGMKEAGAQVELFHTKKLKIAPCRGQSCLDCWFNEKRGVCRQKDSMNDLYPKLQEADIWVLATPVFVDGMSGPLKTFLDRIIPVVEPFIEKRDGHARHVIPKETKKGKIVLVSTCGFPELDNFDPLVSHIKAMAKNAGREYKGALLRPEGPALKFPVMVFPPLAIAKKIVSNATVEAGRLLVKNGEIPQKVLDRISQPLMPQSLYLKILNFSFNRNRNNRKQKP